MKSGNQAASEGGRTPLDPEVLAEDHRPVEERRVPEGETEVDEHIPAIAAEHQRQAHEHQGDGEDRPQQTDVNDKS